MPVEGTPFTPRHYGSKQGIIDLLGPYNESVDADIDSDGNATTKANQEESALTSADTKIDSVLLGAGITAVPVPSDAANYRMLQYAGNRYAAVALSRMRGLPVTGAGKVYDPYAVYTQEADDMLKMYVTYRDSISDTPLPGMFQFIPVTDPTQDADEYAEL